MNDILTYPAVFTIDDDGISIEFPDFKGCISGGKTLSRAMFMARDALSLRLWSDECDAIPFPEPSDILTIPHDSNQAVVLVDVDMKEVRAKHSRKNANVMVTMPEYLMLKARKNDINFSQVIQKALTRELNRKR